MNQTHIPLPEDELNPAGRAALNNIPMDNQKGAFPKLVAKLKTFGNALNIITNIKMKKNIMIAAIAIMTISALFVTAFGAIGGSANDPLNLTQSYGLSDEDKERVNELKTLKSRLETERRDYQIRVDQMTDDIVKIDGEIIKIVSPSTLLPVAQAETITVAPVEETGTDLDKLAYAVAMAETKNCELGYGAMYSNCFGIKRGSIVPCETGQNNMCIFASKDESYRAFKKIWTEGYGGGFPTRSMAATWTGNDRPDNWMKNVSHYYNK